MFWGEQPPFMPFGCGGRYFFALMELPQTQPTRDRRGTRLSWPLALLLLVLLLALLAGFIFYRLETWPGRTVDRSVTRLEELGRKARDTFVELAHLQPKVDGE